MAPLADMAPVFDDDVKYEDWRVREAVAIKYLEDITSDPMKEQERVLKHILKKNAMTDYLQTHGLNGAVDVEAFRKCLPLVDYGAYRGMIERIANGDTSPLLSADPPVELLVSSGTSSGDAKLFPVTAEDLELRYAIWKLVGPVVNRSIPSLQKGKFLLFAFSREGTVSPGGLVTHSAVTSFVASNSFKRRPFNPSYRLTSPDEVVGSVDTEAAMYCHLVCGLVQRLEVLRIGAIFATALLKVFRALELLWPEICEDLANGTLSEVRVKDEAIRAVVLPMLRPNPELAALVRQECTRKLFPHGHGIIRRLWPNVEILDTCISGGMSAYVPSLANLSDNLRVMNTSLYSCTEGFFGINLKPQCSQEDICYTLLPSIAYYEFIPVQAAPNGEDPTKTSGKGGDADMNGIVGLADVKIGREYQIIVTTVSGLCRLQIGDILKAVGYYNSTPTFKFMRRMNVVLSVDSDKTDEQDLYNAVSKATVVLEKEVPWMRLHDFTSHTDLSTSPGHYVIFWELSTTTSDRDESVPPADVLEKCCATLEASLNFIYREARYENGVGPLELRLVQSGTFDLMYEHAVSRGASMAQYKTPRGVRSRQTAVLQILCSGTVRSHVSQTKPPFTRCGYRYRR